MTEPEMSEGEFRKLMADDELLNRIKELETVIATYRVEPTVRWLASKSTQAPPMTPLTIIGPGGPSPITVTHKKLQYRKLIATLEGEPIQWTEWEDVPSVE